ncbi:MAG: hypothetical protein J0I73_11820 [Sphingomonas sp.]|nr:hypothetical protein [Sphingomonas sp.]
MALPKILDLLRLASDLRARGTHGSFTGPLRKAATAQSCLADLRQAGHCCEVFRSTEHPGREDEYSAAHRTVQQSLLMMAVSLYSRATHSTGQYGERGAIQVSSRLPPQLLADHAAVVALRNKAMAHVYFAEDHEDGVWHDQFLFAIQDLEKGWLPGSATRTTQTRPKTLLRLERLIPEAGGILSRQFQKHLQTAMNAFNAASVDVNLADYTDNAEEYFPSESFARAILRDAAPKAETVILGDNSA